MEIFDTLRIRIAAIFQRSEVRAEMDEELRSHIQHRADDLERNGMDRAEAERRARIEFGGREHYKEESYEALGGHFFDTLLQDVRFALRVLRKSRGFTFAAIVTLALAIGANAVVFGLLDGFVLRPLNVPQSESLYGTNYGNNPVWQSFPNYLDLRPSTWFWVWVWTRARIRASRMDLQRPGTISTCCAFAPILGASSTSPMNVVRTALRISC
jgi:hypothetical protein